MFAVSPLTGIAQSLTDQTVTSHHWSPPATSARELRKIRKTQSTKLNQTSHVVVCSRLRMLQAPPARLPTCHLRLTLGVTVAPH
jgi:hypothetical protein